MKDADKDLVREGLRITHAGLKEIKDTPDYAPTYLQGYLEDNWSSINDSVAVLDDSLDSLTSVEEAGMEQVGLTGGHLEMKVEGMRTARTRYDQGQSTQRVSWRRRALGRVLRWSNIFLGSLSKVLPGAELLKEYKEAAEQGLDEAENP